MAREKPTYRLHLEQIRERFAGKTILTRTEVMEYTGKGRTFLDSHGFKGKRDITAVELAEFMAGL